MFQQSDHAEYYATGQRCDLSTLDQEMPVTTAHLMLTKHHPAMKRLNKAIERNRIKLAEIEAKYSTLVKKYDQCTDRRRFRPLSKSIFT